MSSSAAVPASPSLAPAAAERARVAAIWRRWLPATLARQRLDGAADDGGFDQDGSGWLCGRHAAYTLARLLAARLWARELQTDIQTLDTACVRALAFLLRRQAPDGRLDLGGMYSANEIGFPVTALALAWRRLQAAEHPPAPGFLADLLDFCVRGGEAVLAGSALTANHRWAAVCAPLAALHLIRPDPRYLARIDALLADGLDLNADGCWEHERSPNYNIVATQGVLALADALDRPALLAPLRRHGEFLLHSLQPNGEMDSTLSHRQDRAEPDRPAASYGVARRLALLTGDGRYTALAEHAWRRHPAPEAELVPLLLQLDSHPGPLPAPRPLPDRYEVRFPATSQVRLRTPGTALGLAADPGGHFFDTVRDNWGGVRRSDDWFHLHHGDVVIESLHLAGGCLQNLQPDRVAPLPDGGYELVSDRPGWTHTLHFLPGSPRAPVRWDWRSRVVVRPVPEGFDLELESSTPHSLVASLVWWIRPGAALHQAGHGPRVLAAGDRVALAGGSPVRLTGADGVSSLTLSGLPSAAHALQIFHPPAIPSRIPQTCAALTLGLRFPVSLRLRLALGR